MRFCVFLSVTLGLPFSQVWQMSAAEISLYQAYYRVNPWGPERSDLNAAMQMHQVAEMHRDPKRRPEAFKLEQFMPFHKRKELDPDELADKLRSTFGKPV